jgi:hypothetical protein
MLARLIFTFIVTVNHAASANSIIEMNVAGEYVCKNTEAINFLDTVPVSTERVATDSFEKLFTIIGKTILTRYPAVGDLAVQNGKFRGEWGYVTSNELRFTVSKAEGWLTWDAIHFEKVDSLVSPYKIATVRYIDAERVKIRVYIYGCTKR